MVDKISHKNVSSEVSSHDKISNKSMVREFYEEAVERKRRTQHSIVTKDYCVAKKNYQEFKKQTKQITKINRKQVEGPQWYQELSDQQISVLDKLFHNMKEDFDLATTKSTRRALKALGVSTFIPHAVVQDAFLKAELYVIDFLQTIKDYVIQKNKDKIGDHTSNIKKDYLPEERILMCSILHLAYPCFIKRLNYFLKDAVPEKNLKYIKLPKSTRSTKKYSSPYLEPLPQPDHPWSKVKEVKFHNMKVRKQRMRNKMKAIQLQQQYDKEIEDEIKTTMQMNITCPKNSVNKMFCKPPVLKQIENENENKLIPEIGSPTVGANNYEDDVMQSSGVVQTAIGEEEWQEQEDAYPMTSREFMESETWRSRRWSTASGETIVTENTSTPDHARHTQPPTQDSWLKKPFGWLNADYKASNVSIDSIDESSTSTLFETNPHKTIVVIDFDNSVDPFDCDVATGDSGKKLGGEQEYDGESDDDVLLSETLRDLNVTKMDANEEKICQMFQNYSVNVATGNQQQPSVFSSGTGITVAKIDRTKHVDTPSMKGVQGSPQQSKAQVAVEDTEKGQSSVIDLEKKMSVHEFLPNDQGSLEVAARVDDGVIDNSATIRDCNHDVCSDERKPPLINEDGSVNMARLHAIIHKLPNWKQLRVVLKLMSIMGDPIASFPEIIELNKLRRWYEIRINGNRHITSKMKQNLMIQSINAWSVPRTKLKSVQVPQNPIQGKGNIGAMKITWDRVDEMKRKIKKTKSEYLFKLKRVSINNARTMYQTMYNDYCNTRLCKNFKQSYYDYFPAKEDDCLFEYVADRKITK